MIPPLPKHRRELENTLLAVGSKLLAVKNHHLMASLEQVPYYFIRLNTGHYVLLQFPPAFLNSGKLMETVSTHSALYSSLVVQESSSASH